MRFDDPDNMPMFAPGSDEAIAHYQEQVQQRKPMSMPFSKAQPPKYEYSTEWDDVVLSEEEVERILQQRGTREMAIHPGFADPTAATRRAIMQFVDECQQALDKLKLANAAKATTGPYKQALNTLVEQAYAQLPEMRIDNCNLIRHGPKSTRQLRGQLRIIFKSAKDDGLEIEG